MSNSLEDAYVEAQAVKGEIQSIEEKRANRLELIEKGTSSGEDLSIRSFEEERLKHASLIELAQKTSNNIIELRYMIGLYAQHVQSSFFSFVAFSHRIGKTHGEDHECGYALNIKDPFCPCSPPLRSMRDRFFDFLSAGQKPLEGYFASPNGEQCKCGNGALNCVPKIDRCSLLEATGSSECACYRMTAEQGIFFPRCQQCILGDCEEKWKNVRNLLNYPTLCSVQCLQCQGFYCPFSMHYVGPSTNRDATEERRMQSNTILPVISRTELEEATQLMREFIDCERSKQERKRKKREYAEDAALLAPLSEWVERQNPIIDNMGEIEQSLRRPPDPATPPLHTPVAKRKHIDQSTPVITGRTSKACRNCHKAGHYISTCPDLQDSTAFVIPRNSSSSHRVGLSILNESYKSS